jgi:hypothetical protein
MTAAAAIMNSVVSSLKSRCIELSTRALPRPRPANQYWYVGERDDALLLEDIRYDKISGLAKIRNYYGSAV